MGQGAIRLEDSNGHELSNPTEAQIRETLARIGSGIEHCILHLSENSFVQAAGGRDRLLLEYSDDAGHFQSGKTDFDASTVADIFVNAMNGNNSWKTDYNFSRSGGAPADSGSSVAAEGSAAGSGRGGASGLGASGGAAGGSIKDKVIGQVKREVGREASYGMNSIIRRVMRTIFGGRRF